MNDAVFNFILALIPLIGFIIVTYVVPIFKQQFSDAQIKNIEYWVIKAVRAAEAMFIEGASGDAKREYVIHFIQDKFNKNGKELITEEQIRILLEAAWEEYIKDRQKKNGTN